MKKKQTVQEVLAEMIDVTLPKIMDEVIKTEKYPSEHKATLMAQLDSILRMLRIVHARMETE